ncbi:MAG: HD domain-containing protein [Bdellovibrionaceae bacterium]|nr:HD domain-containing protein [Pseudobdellovibrionaceae bacterium]
MEIRDPIHGSIELSPIEVTICDSQEYQRLRSIKQLGFSEFSFPGATHNRFLHSVGVSYLAGQAFDSIFKRYPFTNLTARQNLRQCLKLAALLHDIGHGPLSHTTEEVMPPLATLNLQIYDKYKTSYDKNRKANHEDFTIKFITDSNITKIIEDYGAFEPIHVAALIDRDLKVDDSFFVVDGVNFRPILSQLVSSELDVDRMDYLIRDAYFCGTNYGKIELSWLIGNLTYNQVENDMFLALNRRALYTFDDFLLSRHHMHLMVYFHHKAIVYEEMLTRFLKSENCTFSLPSDLQKYIKCTDYALYQHIDEVQDQNTWAKRIATRNPYRVLFEKHSYKNSEAIRDVLNRLEGEGIETIYVSSSTRLSKYQEAQFSMNNYALYVVEEYDKGSTPSRIEDNTEIFEKYGDIRIIERIYVAPEKRSEAQFLLRESGLLAK